ncbi:OLC1v1000350C2 [Oldenlandia corymbosa var. corymbosa]|uniref:OLC1v1000350C2 n=1 Tax=Oldenlandia corymbosa var. corymbosa TaxID=529605 RepID=A0AAV1D2N7_OLDCO|nr:OLC1v1000350C2 [Oldenlandia corymbosa var. corymbosa]
MYMDTSVSSWFSELGMEDPFLNDQYDIMDFLDDELSATLGEDFQGCLSPEGLNALQSPTLIPTSSSTTSLSVLSAMEAPPITIERPAKKQRSNVNGNSNLQNMTNFNPPSSSPMILTFGNPVLPEMNPQQQATTLGNLSPDHDDAVSEVLTSPGPFPNLEDATKKSGKKPAKKSGGRVRPPSQTYDHIIAERKRREQLSQRFVALSAIVPGLKKMDKTSVLGDAINYLKYLQERVKTLEEQAKKQTMESVVVVKRSHVLIEDEGSSDEMNGPDEQQPQQEQQQSLPEIEAKLCNKNILLRIHCENHKGVLVKLLAEVEKLNLSVLSTSVSPFGSFALDITIIALVSYNFEIH